MYHCAYCGRSNEESALRCHECGTELPALPVPDTPPEIPAPRLVDPTALAEAFSFEDSFHRADWNFVRHWIHAHLDPTDSEQAWNEAALLWVGKLREDLGGDYSILQSPQTVLLCERPLETARWLLDYAGRAAITIKEYLADTAWRGAFGKNVVLVFSDVDDYDQYLAHHTPDGEQAASGGVCIHSGYTHIAVPWRDEMDAANAIIHELTHDCLAHLPLPVWLNEGVAVTLQKAIAPPPRALGQSEQDALYAASVNWRAPIMWDDLAARHFAFWTEASIQSFWAGTSFSQPGDPSELSYSLAEVFLKLLSDSTDRNTFRAFLESAHQGDGGQTATMDFLGTDLGEIARTFLGEGNWRPQRKSMVACWSVAGWQKGPGEGNLSRVRSNDDLSD
jgi:hypothetical protein